MAQQQAQPVTNSNFVPFSIDPYAGAQVAARPRPIGGTSTQGFAQGALGSKQSVGGSRSAPMDNTAQQRAIQQITEFAKQSGQIDMTKW